MLEGFNQNVSTYAADVDRAFWITTGISIAMFVLVAGLMALFIVRYHHTKVQPGEIRNIRDHLGLEIAWTVIPTILLFVIFYYGYTSFRDLRTMPKDAFTVDVLGKRWSWTFTYPNGKQTDELYVPVGKNIKLIMGAPDGDVLHSFFVPAFRVKEDVVPGRKTHIWFNATKPGRYDIECAEYCGVRHAKMLSKVEVMKAADFDAWYASDKLSPHDMAAPKSKGEMLYKTLGCASCHSLDGSIIVGPSFAGLFGKNVTVMTGDKTRRTVVDDAYLERAIREPGADVAEGFPDGVMPDLSGQIDAEQLKALVTFIKEQNGGSVLPEAAAPAATTTMEPAAAPATTEAEPTAPQKASAAPDGATLFNAKGCGACHSLDGTKKLGPTLKGLYGSKLTVVTDGKSREVTADEAYLRSSLETPNADVVEGFAPGLMPPFGKMLSAEEIETLVTYMKELK
ncbi:cytochrome c oxidase subunit II [Sulfurimonas sp. HSL1-6]|uniref:cytochrome c oxidase subunit II n=1 Tax=Thiomicrolovo immobilis TaxID=3131935 RepID=UPI0031FA437D